MEFSRINTYLQSFYDFSYIPRLFPNPSNFPNDHPVYSNSMYEHDQM